MKRSVLVVVALSGGVVLCARPDKTNDIKKNASVQYEVIEVPPTANGYKIQWAKHPQSKPDHWSVDFGDTSPCAESSQFDDDGKGDTCTITTDSHKHQFNNCKITIGASQSCFKYTVTAKTGGDHPSTNSNDPVVIVDDSSDGRPPKPAK